MIINLNQQCDVILTAHGAEVYNKYFRKQHAICKLIELTNLKAGRCAIVATLGTDEYIW